MTTRNPCRRFTSSFKSHRRLKKKKKNLLFYRETRNRNSIFELQLKPMTWTVVSSFDRHLLLLPSLERIKHVSSLHFRWIVRADFKPLSSDVLNISYRSSLKYIFHYLFSSIRSFLKIFIKNITNVIKIKSEIHDDKSSIYPR